MTTKGLRRWLSLAFDETDAINATQAIAHHRDEREAAGHARVRSYEVQLVDDEAKPLLDVFDTIMPRFMDHMVSLKLPARGSPGVFFSVFVGDRLYFIESIVTSELYEELRKTRPPIMLPGRRH